MEENYDDIIPVIEGEVAECGDLPIEAEDFSEEGDE